MQPQPDRPNFPEEQGFSWPIFWNYVPSMPYPDPCNPWPYVVAYNNQPLSHQYQYSSALIHSPTQEQP